MTNPFNPSFGKRPSHFIGRKDIQRELMFAVDDINSPWRTTLITGIRGSGKTALLSDLRIRYEDKNVATILLVPSDRMLNSLIVGLLNAFPKKLLPRLPELKELSLNVGVGGAKFGMKNDESYIQNTFEYQFAKLMDAYNKYNVPVVLLIDEAQKHTSEMRELIIIYQQYIMQDYNISMVMTGLPKVISDVLNDDVLTFMRRSKQVSLDNLPIDFVKLEYRQIFKGLMDLETINNAADATLGYPYLIQLVGYYLWQEVHESKNKHDTEQAMLSYVMTYVKAELNDTVHRLVYASLSLLDRQFVQAMTEDDHESLMSDISVRLGKKHNLISRYRERLIDVGVIKSTGHGTVAFRYPYMKDYILTKS